MIRGWSHLILFNICMNSFLKLQFRYLFLNFKKSIIFKRFYFKRTKFNRKSLARIKHKNNWVIYRQIFKYWIEDFNKYKAYCKFQFNHKLAKINLLSQDSNHTRKYKNRGIIHLNYYISGFLNKNFAKHFFFFKFRNNFYNSCSHYTYVLQLENLKLFDEHNFEITPIGLIANNEIFSFNEKNFKDLFLIDFNFENIFTNTNQLIINQYLEIYKSLILLWINTLFKR